MHALYSTLFAAASCKLYLKLVRHAYHAQCQQVTAQDEKHARYRDALNPLFLQPVAVASYTDAIAQEVNNSSLIAHIIYSSDSTHFFQYALHSCRTNLLRC
jgi:hypothetical protein